MGIAIRGDFVLRNMGRQREGIESHWNWNQESTSVLNFLRHCVFSRSLHVVNQRMDVGKFDRRGGV